MTQMTEINTPHYHTPRFNDLYPSRVVELNDFDSVTLYAEFTCLINARPITTDVKEGVINFFDISFIPDPAIDLMCFKAFLPIVSESRTPSTPQKQSPPFAKAKSSIKPREVRTSS